MSDPQPSAWLYIKKARPRPCAGPMEGKPEASYLEPSKYWKQGGMTTAVGMGEVMCIEAGRRGMAKIKVSTASDDGCWVGGDLRCGVKENNCQIKLLRFPPGEMDETIY